MKSDSKVVSRHQSKLLDDGAYTKLLAETDSIINSSSAPLDIKLVAYNNHVSTLVISRNYSEALRTLQSAIRLSKTPDLIFWNTVYYISMAQIFLDLGDEQDAEKSLNRAHEYFGREEWSHVSPKMRAATSTVFATTLSQLELKKGNPGHALDIWKSASTENVIPEIKLVWLGQGGTLLKINKDTLAAKACLEEALAMPCGEANKPTVANILADILISRREYASAIDHLNKYGNSYSASSNLKVSSDRYRLLADAWQSLDNNDSATAYREKYYVLSDSISKMDRDLLNHLLREKIDPADYAILQDQLKDSDTKKYWILSCGCLCIIILGAWIFLLRFRRKRERQEIQELQKSIMENKVDYEEKIGSLSDEIETHTSTLSNSMLRLSQIDNGLKSIREELNSKNKSSEERLAAIKMRLIEIGINSENTKAYTAIRTRSGRELIRILTELHPSLTKGELELCCFIQMGLSTKEIALMTNRSIRTIESFKYSIKKKLELPSSVDTYIRSLMI